MTVFVQHKRNSAILKPVKEAFRADMVTLRWEGNTLLFKSFVAGWKTVCGACKRAVCLCFLGCAGRHTLLTELSAAGLLGVAVDKVTRCVAIPALLAVWEWRRQVGVSCAAKSSVSSLLCKKGLLYMGFAQYSSPFCILDPLSHRRALPISSKKNFDSISQQMKKLSMMGCFFGAAVCSGNSLLVSREFTRRATVSVGNERGSCRFPLRPSCEKAAQPSPQAWLSCKIKMQFLELCAERSGAHLKSFCFGQKCSYSGFTCSSCSQ